MLSVPDAAGMVGVSTDIVNFLIRKEFIKAESHVPEGKQRALKFLDEAAVARLCVFARAYRSGYSTEAAVQIAQDSRPRRSALLAQITRATSSLMFSLWNRADENDDPRIALMSEVCEVVRAECSLLFTEGCTRPGHVTVDAGWWGGRAVDKHFSARVGPLPDSVRDLWLTEHAQDRRAIRRFARTAQIDSFFEFIAADVLPSRKAYSLMCQPLFTRKELPLGFLVVLNRLGEGSDRPNEASAFDSRDEAILKHFASLIEQAAELEPALYGYSELIGSVYTNSGLPEFLHELLKHSVLRTGARRGEVAWLQRDGSLRIVAQIQSEYGRSRLSLNDVAPYPSIAAWAFETKNDIIMKNRAVEPYRTYYYDAWEPTQSQLAVPLIIPDIAKALGVINLDSDQPNFFDEQDLFSVRTIAAPSALYGALIESRPEISQIIQTMVSGRKRQLDDAETKRHIRHALRAIGRQLRFRSVCLYSVDYPSSMLKFVLHDDGESAVSEAFPSIRFTERSIATRVFRTGAAYSTMDSANDPFMSERGREVGIKGPLLGLPLRYQNAIVGILTAWDSTVEPRIPDDAGALERAAMLAVGILMDIGNVDLLEKVRSLQLRLQSKTDEPGLLDFARDCLYCLLSCFDTARAWRYVDEDDKGNWHYLCIASVDRDGMDDRYANEVLTAERGSYSAWIRNMEKQQKGIIIEPSDAQPADEATFFNRDPKSPWAVYPLIVADRRLGHIACDQSLSGRTITETDLETMSLFGQLIAEALHIHSAVTKNPA